MSYLVIIDLLSQLKTWQQVAFIVAIVFIIFIFCHFLCFINRGTLDFLLIGVAWGFMYQIYTIKGEDFVFPFLYVFVGIIFAIRGIRYNLYSILSIPGVILGVFLNYCIGLLGCMFVINIISLLVAFSGIIAICAIVYVLAPVVENSIIADAILSICSGAKLGITEFLALFNWTRKDK